MEYGLYIHIPFCRSRCRYCDFHTRPGFEAVPQAYVEALLRALDKYRPWGENGEAPRPVTVYFGGGTPGLLSPAQVERLLLAANPAEGAEVTLEANPGGDIGEKLDGWRRAGVNRLSLGVQSARDESLRTLGRTHTAAGAAEALAQAKAAGFENLSGDIMLGLPGYSRAEFDETLALLRGGGASHISAYLLKLEPETPFGRRPPPGLPEDDEAAEFYLYALECLQSAGYGQYEISNFALPGRESRHNLLYWDCGRYLGIGPAAHSSLLGKRFSFAPDTEAFLRGATPPQSEGEVTAEDYIMLRLRLSAGLSQAALAARFGARLTGAQVRRLGRYVQAGYAKQTGDGWALTPRGMLVQNSLLAELLT